MIFTFFQQKIKSSWHFCLAQFRTPGFGRPFFLSFQVLLPTSGGPMSHKPVTFFIVFPDAIQGAHIFKGAEELGLGGNQLPNLSKIVSHGRIFFVLPVGGEKKTKRTHLKDGKFGKLLLGEWDGFLLFTTFNFWLLASNLTNCRHEVYEVSKGYYCEYWPSNPRRILPMFCQSI